MEIVRNISRIGNSKGIILPKEWFESFEEQHGYELEKVRVKINSDVVISPFVEAEEKVKVKIKEE